MPISPGGSISASISHTASEGQKGPRSRKRANASRTRAVPRPRQASPWRPSRVGRLELKIKVIK